MEMRENILFASLGARKYTDYIYCLIEKTQYSSGRWRAFPALRRC